jgi:hypothetical protein
LKSDKIDIPKFDYLWQYVDYWATQDPDFPLIRFKWKKYNAKEFKEAIDQLAKAFINLGVKRGDRIITIPSYDYGICVNLYSIKFNWSNMCSNGWTI